MILVAIGANLPHPDYGPARVTCGAALFSFKEENIHITAYSRWYESPPFPPSGQPNYVNAVVRVETDLPPDDLMAALLAIETRFGRTRAAKNDARTLDLDLLDYHGQCLETQNGLILPHPRLTDRAFVLLPLADIAPDWRHPVSGTPLGHVIAALPADHGATPMPNGPGVYGTDWNAGKKGRKPA
ncbi:MAG: 2-amino-4-hydroxy-6-hydroxymethyldihydropteridine diphosphokinase [Rhodospirillales bacterium]